jgi:hypothetical protein
MHAALERFVIDLKTGLLTHDGCPDTAGTSRARSRSVAADVTSTDWRRRRDCRRSTPE